MCNILVFIILLMIMKHNSAQERRALMLDPPQRSSLWRFGYKTPINIKDSLLNCGGFTVQWNDNNGKCGVCGDPANGPQDHDDNGKHASGTVVRSYSRGSYVNVTVEVLSNMLGYFEFRLCPRNNTDTKLTQECFDKNMLWIEESWGYRYFVGSLGGIFDLHVRLPGHITCQNCVFQWKYSTGYRMGGINECAAMGTGKQEQFYNCADIEILPRNITQTTVYPQAILNTHEPVYLLPSNIDNLTERELGELRQQINLQFSSPMSTDTDNGHHTDILTPDFLGHTLIPSEPLRRTGDFPLIKGINVDIPYWSKLENDTTTKQPKVIDTTTSTKPTSVVKLPKETPPSTSEISPPPIIPRHTQPPPSIIQPPVRLPPPPPFQLLVGPHINLSRQDPVTPKVPKSPIQPLYDSVAIVSSDSITFPLFGKARPRKVGEGIKPKPQSCTVNSPKFKCKGRGQYRDTKGIDEWCLRHCRIGNCVKFMCDCSCEDKKQKCHAVGVFQSIANMNEWCIRNCSSGVCPANICNVKHCL